MSLALDELPDAIIFQTLNALDDVQLVQARGISSRFKGLADQLLLERFLQRWPVAGLATSLVTPTCLVPVRLEHFAWWHVVSKSDSLARIAIKYSTNMALLKRVNNILSDHTLATRDSVFIPVGALEDVQSKSVAYVYCAHAKRRFLVVLRDGEEPPQPAALHGSSHERAMRQLTAMLQRGLRVDESTAQYYMAQAGGSIRAAMAAFEDDSRWERVMRPSRRR